MLNLRRFFPAAAATVFSALAFVSQSIQAREAPTADPAPASTATQRLPSGVKSVTSVEGVQEYVLANGLRVLLVPDQSKPTTTVNMTYLVGSRHESYGETGMAHLLEHMLFKGTLTTRNALGEFSRRGLRANGSTSQDRTNYFASFAANPDTLQWYLGWQADAMINSTILRSDLDTEMTVVRNEMESGENNPFRILLQKMLAAAYQWHNYGKSTIGARSDVENVDIEQLRAFYRRYYQPDNAVLIVAGQFDPQTTLTGIARDFGRIPRPERVLPPLYTVEPVQDGERTVTLRRTGGTPLVAALYHVPQAASPESVAAEALTVVMGDTPSGRLYHNLVSEGKASSIFAFSLDQHDPGTVMFGAQLEAAMDQSEALWALIDTVETTVQTPVTQEELDRARAKLLIDWEQTYSDPQRVGVALSEAIAAGDWRLFFLRRDRIRDLKLPEVQRVAEQWLVRSNRTEGRYIPTEQPQRAPASTPVDLQAVFKDYKGDPDFQQVEAFDPTPANIDARTDLRTLELSNGQISLALLPKATRGARVQARLQLAFGDVESLKGQRLVADTVAELLDRGTPELSRQQIQDRFDQLNAEVGFDGSGTNVGVAITTTRENLPEVVSLVLQILRNANFPEEQVTEYRRNLLTGLRAAMTDPTQIAARTLARHDNPWPKDDVRYVPSFDESLKDVESIQRDPLVAFHGWFYGAGRIHFTAVGDFDADAVQKALVAGVEGWQQAPAWQRIPSPYRDVKPARFVNETPDKANAFYIARLPLPLQDDDPDFVALYLANSLLGQSETSRLWTRIREKEGLSYDVRSMLTASSFEKSGDWTMYAIYAPENRERLETALREELARVVKEGFTEEEVREGVDALLNQRRLTRAQDGALANAWLGYLDTGRTFAWSAKIDEQLAALTTDQVNAIVRKYLKPDQFTASLAGDFAKKR
ncbi:insulinase family protein [Achromobacter sp. GG226]|uniref:M16 family metallopeptidase n=1 Tax=Verticiella alkaliphila TaxID=2779529 RepID=UPI001C0B31DD|nr:pitrilysin family protein [Verticiella sp. GG226]MBU4612151.1 insulinase family protein [Verticiella sp. GG226]